MSILKLLATPSWLFSAALKVKKWWGV